MRKATEKQIRYIKYLACRKKANLGVWIGDKHYLFLRGEAQFNLDEIDRKTASVLIEQLKEYNKDIARFGYILNATIHKMREQGMSDEEIKEELEAWCEGSY